MTQPPYPPGEPPREFPRYGQPYQPPHPQQYGAPQRGGPSAWYLPPPVRTSGLAVAALITALCGLGPVAAGLGIAALVSLRSSRLEGFGMAVAGVAIGTVETLLLVVAIAIGVGADDDPGPVYTPPAGGTYDPGPPADPEGELSYLDEVSAGDCFNDSPEDEAEVFTVACAKSHDGEVTAKVTLPAGRYPGDRGVEDLADASCDKEFAMYVGTTVQRTSLRPAAWMPDREAWESGDREVVCATWGPDGDRLTGSVRGTKR